ncbi:hypothetical protein CRX42_14065 [Pseudomonas jessenii]|uniref:Uncharacterized protein n=1 Tax=Pseudomonas jessenii TaxID=77298 RepID=A0A2W0EQG3_PSEJE|nr:hypothetical protein CRX42_14065 [Pseudomonas jessenii]
MFGAFFGPFTGLEAPSLSTRTRSLVGAGLPAMVVNDNAYELDKRGALESIAGKPAPTVSRECVKILFYSSLLTSTLQPHRFGAA